MAVDRTNISLPRRVMGRVIGIGHYSPSVQQRAVRGSVLALSSRFLIKIIQFSRTIVIARLLFPDDVGLFALATATLGIADILVQPGMNAAVIQREFVERRHLDTAWTSNVLRSAAIGMIAFLAAPLASTFFDLPEIALVMQVLAVGIVINGFENIGAILLVRDIQFNRKMLYDLSLVISETIAIIIGAIILKSFWALVIGSLVSKIAAIIFSFALHPYRPRFLFDREAFTELFSFGKWVGAMGVVSYFVAQGDTLTAGKLFGPEAAGYYALAFGLALMPAVDIARTLGGVLFPHLSRLPQEERGSAFLAMVRSVLLISVPSTVGLVVVAEPLVRMIYGERWVPLLPTFYVLACYAFLRVLSYLIEPLYWSMGRPRVVATSTAIHLAVMVAAMLPASSMFGLPGVAVAVLGGAAASLTYLLYGIRREKVVRLNALVRAAALPILAALVMVCAISVFLRFADIDSKMLLMVEVGVGVVAYSTALSIIDAIRGGSVRRSLLWLRVNL